MIGNNGVVLRKNVDGGYSNNDRGEHRADNEYSRGSRGTTPRRCVVRVLRQRGLTFPTDWLLGLHH